MKYEFIEEHHSLFRVTKMCQVLEVKPSGYYSWKKRGKSKRYLENINLLKEIRKIEIDFKNIYGSPRITDELNDRGFDCGENRVARIMKENGIAAKTKKKFKVTTQSKHDHSVAENLLKQDFSATCTDSIWISDITYIWTKEGWLYLAAIMDLYSRQIIGWSMDKRLNQDLVINALNQAVGKRNPGTGVIFHSDRGVQYAGNDFCSLLNSHGFIQSMSGKGNCYDNAVMESFFHTLKVEHIYFERYKTRDEARESIFEYIEIFYNRVRKHSALEYKSPAEYEELLIPA